MTTVNGKPPPITEADALRAVAGKGPHEFFAVPEHDRCWCGKPREDAIHRPRLESENANG